jgi:hypothetical protein
MKCIGNLTRLSLVEPRIVRVSREIEMISAGSFQWSPGIQTLDCEPLWRFGFIGETGAEKWWKFSSMSIPASMEILCRSCFRTCVHPGKVHFETRSKLRRIGTDSFRGCSALTGLFVPMSVKRHDGIDLNRPMILKSFGFEQI